MGWLRDRLAPEPGSRVDTDLLEEVLARYGLGSGAVPLTTYDTSKGEPIGNSFADYASLAYKANGIVFAVTSVRMLLFAEARFQFRQFSNGKPGDLFGTPDLGPLERPWPGGTTGELLARMEQDITLAGNAYIAKRGDRLVRLRPDAVTIVWRGDDPNAIDLEVVGYQYQPDRDKPAIVLPVSEVAHYSPYPDPEARWRGMSWLTPVLREIESDKLATTHKSKFFEQGATPNMIVKVDPAVTPEKFQQFKVLFDEQHKGAANAYKTLFLGGGADATVVGSNFQQLDFKATQGAGETRIAAAAGVHPVIVGLSEGLQGSALNAGNYSQARRRLADGTMRPLWRIAAASLEKLVTTPPGASLWYDDRHIAFLRDDAKDEAEIHSTDAQTVRALVEAGFKPDAVIDAVIAGDFAKLKGEHTGLYSVQLQEPIDPNAPPAGAPVAPSQPDTPALAVVDG
jgi:phage portal protein BeeE